MEFELGTLRHECDGDSGEFLCASKSGNIFYDLRSLSDGDVELPILQQFRDFTHVYYPG